MKEHAASVVSDEAFEKRSERWPDNTPDTKEGYFIRDVFDSASRYFSVWECRSPDPSRHVSRRCRRDCHQVRPSCNLRVLLGTKLSNPLSRWLPRADWGCASDPSGRSVSIHQAAYTEPS